MFKDFARDWKGTPLFDLPLCNNQSIMSVYELPIYCPAFLLQHWSSCRKSQEKEKSCFTGLSADASVCRDSTVVPGRCDLRNERREVSIVWHIAACLKQILLWIPTVQYSLKKAFPLAAISTLLYYLFIYFMFSSICRQTGGTFTGKEQRCNQKQS